MGIINSPQNLMIRPRVESPLALCLKAYKHNYNSKAENMREGGRELLMLMQLSLAIGYCNYENLTMIWTKKLHLSPSYFILF